jgi:hypothetical protein
MAAPHLNPAHKGAFDRWLGKKPGAPITAADIAKGKAAGGHAAQMANFAKSAKGWKHGKSKKRRARTNDEHAASMYGRKPVSKTTTG